MKYARWFCLAAFLAAPAYAQRGNPVSQGTPFIPTCTAITGSCPASNYVCVSGSSLYQCVLPATWTQIAGASSGLASNPAACSANQFVNDLDQDGTLTCAQPAFSDLSGAATDGQIPNDITITLAAAASGLTCTDCINATEIEDIYLFNSGDVGTGAYDFGGASDFEVPNGTGPTVNAAGEVGVDTTDDQFVYYGGAARVLPYEFEKCVALEDPVDADDNIPFYFPRNAITITDVYCEVDGGTSIALTISDGTNALEAITCDGDGAEDDGSIANGTFTALERMEFDLGSASGTSTWLAFCITYTVDRQ